MIPGSDALACKQAFLYRSPDGIIPEASSTLNTRQTGPTKAGLQQSDRPTAHHTTIISLLVIVKAFPFPAVIVILVHPHPFPFSL
jgi:hypothetical protein